MQQFQLTPVFLAHARATVFKFFSVLNLIAGNVRKLFKFTNRERQ